MDFAGARDIRVASTHVLINRHELSSLGVVICQPGEPPLHVYLRTFIIFSIYVTFAVDVITR